MSIFNFKGFNNMDNEDNGDIVKRKKLNMLVVWIIIISILILSVSSLLSGKDSKTDENKKVTPVQEYNDLKTYTANMELQLQETLSKIKGAGKVIVLIDIENNGEKILAKDTKSNSEHGTNAENVNMSTETEESIVISGQGASQEPIVIAEKNPRPTGILVVAEGASDESIKFEIYEAVKALYGISPHRIKVVASGE